MYPGQKVSGRQVLIKEIFQSDTEWTSSEFSICSAEHLMKDLLISNLFYAVFSKS